MESVHWSRGDLGGAQKQIFVLIFDDLLCRLDEETINIESLTRLPTRHSSFSGNWSLSFHKPLKKKTSVLFWCTSTQDLTQKNKQSAPQLTNHS